MKKILGYFLVAVAVLCFTSCEGLDELFEGDKSIYSTGHENDVPGVHFSSHADVMLKRNITMKLIEVHKIYGLRHVDGSYAENGKNVHEQNYASMYKYKEITGEALIYENKKDEISTTPDPLIWGDVVSTVLGTLKYGDIWETRSIKEEYDELDGTEIEFIHNGEKINKYFGYIDVLSSDFNELSKLRKGKGDQFSKYPSNSVNGFELTKDEIDEFVNDAEYMVFTTQIGNNGSGVYFLIFKIIDKGYMLL